ncbi:MAG: DUF4870 domain-containing protein [archaeon]|jgi:hypothetical protein
MVAKKGTKTETKQDNTMAVLTHLLGIFVGFLGPLIVLLATKDTNLKNHARKALNWQLTCTILSIIILFIVFVGIFGSMLLIMVNPIFFALYFLSFALMIPLMLISIVNLAFCIIAAVKANEGTLWNYPFSIQILKTE